MESIQYFKDLGATNASSLKVSQQCKDAAGKANGMFGFININFPFKNKDIILALYISLVQYLVSNSNPLEGQLCIWLWSRGPR